MKSVVSSKGQITIPVAAQRALGLRAGTPVELELRPEGLLLRKCAAAAGGVDRVYGILPGEGPVDAILERLRGPRLAAAGPRRRGQAAGARQS